MSESDTEITDSPRDWVGEHIHRYVETAGEDGYEWRGVPTLLLTTRGRRSHKLRRTALIFGRAGEAYIVIASKGGAPQHPLWYENLVVDPDVTIQVRGDVFAARARTAHGEERDRLWKSMTDFWPAYDEYQERVEREIPLVVIEPIA